MYVAHGIYVNKQAGSARANGDLTLAEERGGKNHEVLCRMPARIELSDTHASCASARSLTVAFAILTAKFALYFQLYSCNF